MHLHRLLAVALLTQACVGATNGPEAADDPARRILAPDQMLAPSQPGLRASVAAAHLRPDAVKLEEDPAVLSVVPLTPAQWGELSEASYAALTAPLEADRVALRVESFAFGADTLGDTGVVGFVLDGQPLAGLVHRAELVRQDRRTRTHHLIVQLAPAMTLYDDLDAWVEVRPDPSLEPVHIRLDQMEGEDLVCPAGRRCTFTSNLMPMDSLVQEFLDEVAYIPEPRVGPVTRRSLPDDYRRRAFDDERDDAGRLKSDECSGATKSSILALLSSEKPEWKRDVERWARDSSEPFPMDTWEQADRDAFRDRLNDSVGADDAHCFGEMLTDLADAERLRRSIRSCDADFLGEIRPVIDFEPNFDVRFDIRDREFWIAAAGQVDLGITGTVDGGAALDCKIDFIRLIERKTGKELRVKVPIISAGEVDLVYAYFRPVLEARLRVAASVGRASFRYVRHEAFAGVFGYSATAYPNSTPAIERGFNARVSRLEPTDWDGGNDGLTSDFDFEEAYYAEIGAELRAGVRIGLFGGLEVGTIKLFGARIPTVKAGVDLYGQVHGRMNGTFRLGDRDPAVADCHWHGRVDAGIEATAGYRIQVGLFGVRVLDIGDELEPWVIWEPADRDGDGHSDPLWTDSWPSRFCPGEEAPFNEPGQCFADDGSLVPQQCSDSCLTTEWIDDCGREMPCVRPANYCAPGTPTTVSRTCGLARDGSTWSPAVVTRRRSCDAATCTWSPTVARTEEVCGRGSDRDSGRCFYDGGEATCCDETNERSRQCPIQ